MLAMLVGGLIAFAPAAEAAACRGGKRADGAGRCKAAPAKKAKAKSKAAAKPAKKAKAAASTSEKGPLYVFIESGGCRILATEASVRRMQDIAVGGSVTWDGRCDDGLISGTGVLRQEGVFIEGGRSKHFAYYYSGRARNGIRVGSWTRESLERFDDSVTSWTSLAHVEFVDGVARTAPRPVPVGGANRHTESFTARVLDPEAKRARAMAEAPSPTADVTARSASATVSGPVTTYAPAAGTAPPVPSPVAGPKAVTPSATPVAPPAAAPVTPAPTSVPAPAPSAIVKATPPAPVALPAPQAQPKPAVPAATAPAPVSAPMLAPIAATQVPTPAVAPKVVAPPTAPAVPPVAASVTPAPTSAPAPVPVAIAKAIPPAPVALPSPPQAPPKSAVPAVAAPSPATESVKIAAARTVPSPATPAPAAKLTPNLPEGMSKQAFGFGTGCYMDTLDGQLWENSVLTVKDRKSLRIEGWAVDDEERVLPEATYLRLEGANGRRYYAATVTLERPDVARHFGVPAFVKAGYRAIVSAEGLPPGEYEATIVMNSKGRNLFCGNGRRLRL